MAKRKKNEGEKMHLFVFLFLLIAVFLCFIGILFSVVISIDRADELFNIVRYQSDWRSPSSIYQNEWYPFASGNFMDHVRDIPHQLYIGFNDFTGAAFVGLLFWPLLIFVVPFYEAFVLMEFQMLMLGWIPFGGGVLLFVLTGLFCEMDRMGQKAKDNENQPV